MNAKSPIILALDSLEVEHARNLIELTAESVGIYKFGLEFYLRNGLPALQSLKRAFPDLRVFLDLKLHDIPNTVGGAARAISEIEPEILTVHASGGKGMIRSAKALLPKTTIAAVTILTSLNERELQELGLAKNLNTLVISLATSAQDAGASAIVCSPLELSSLRSQFPGLKLITPGIREASSPTDDQARTMTASQARNAGADYLVIGRPITKAADPRAAAAAIYASIR